MSNENRKTILLVEDDAILAMTGKKNLEKYGYKVVTVFTGEKAVELFNSNPVFDLILMDIDLGSGIDGTQAAEIILKKHNIPIVFHSSHTEPEVVEKTEKITSYGYVVKNSGITVLDASIKMAFKLRKQKEETELNGERLESLLRISQYKTTSIQQMLDFALEEAIILTHSKIGYIYFYDESKRQFLLNAWSKDVLKECAIQNYQTKYDLDKTGIWGEAVRQKKPIVVNDFIEPNPLKNGTPEGHVKLLKFLTIPVIFEDKIVAVAGVANKEMDYNDSDIRQLTLLMDAVWKIAENKRSEKELQKKMEELQQFHRLTIGRELKMIELKKEINEILKKTGQEEKYRIVE